MADSAQLFVAVRTNPPYWPAVLHTLQQQDASASFGGVQDNPLAMVVYKSTPWTAAQITAVQNVINTAPDDAPQIEAQFYVDIASIFERAAWLTLLDQINTIRAALPTPLAAITPAQMVAAIRSKAATLN